MNYKIEERSKFVSTSLQGYLKASYEELVKVFGEPQCTTPSGDGKVDVEWDMNILDEDHNAIRPFTIYNWKDYDGGREAMSNPDYIWHIGGTSGIVDMYINEYFKKKVA
ncbi:MAG: hypothetical protein ACKVJK_00865 [Methylophagaceae bacterium]|jgi:hypothetical protein|tara:strand:- start:318 stop:644 length:327 start_codon:yes stop_codon:yes gene_type:complete